MSEFKKRVQVVHTVGEKLNLLMIKSEKNSMPIARTNEGMICLLSKDAKGFFPYESEWECEIVEVREKLLIFKPLKCIKSVEIVKHEITEAINSLKKSDRFAKSEKIREELKKKTYPYLSQHEINMGNNIAYNIA